MLISSLLLALLATTAFSQDQGADQAGQLRIAEYQKNAAARLSQVQKMAEDLAITVAKLKVRFRTERPSVDISQPAINVPAGTEVFIVGTRDSVKVAYAQRDKNSADTTQLFALLPNAFLSKISASKDATAVFAFGSDNNIYRMQDPNKSGFAQVVQRHPGFTRLDAFFTTSSTSLAGGSVFGTEVFHYNWAPDGVRSGPASINPPAVDEGAVSLAYNSRGDEFRADVFNGITWVRRNGPSGFGPWQTFLQDYPTTVAISVDEKDNLVFLAASYQVINADGSTGPSFPGGVLSVSSTSTSPRPTPIYLGLGINFGPNMLRIRNGRYFFIMEDPGSGNNFGVFGTDGKSLWQQIHWALISDIMSFDFLPQ